MKIVGNYVLFEPYWDNHYMELGEGKIKIDPTFRKGHHQPVRGKVVAVPYRLRYGDSVMLDWDTPMELQPGDEIVVNYNEIHNSLRSYRRSYIIQDDRKLLFVRYDKINAAKRNGKIIPVNGYIYIEPIPPRSLDNLENPFLKENTRDRVWGVVRHVGSRNKAYFYSDEYKDDFDPPVGGVVGMMPHSDLYVESPDHLIFFEGKRMLKVQRPYITSLLEGVKAEER
jgi:hypothetical protein